MNTIPTMPMLAGKVAIVTGASSGIGLAVTNSLLASAALVLGVDISPAPESLASHITAKTFAFHQCNLTTSGAAEAVVAACKAAFGDRIDILLNVAGVMDTYNSADTLDDETWDRVIAINLTAPVKLMRAVLPTMKQQTSGSVVNVASKAGTSGAAAGIAYTCSKHGLIGATKNVAWRFHDEGIRCNAISPGAVSTNISKSADFSKTDMAAFLKMKPIINLNLNLDKMEIPMPPENMVAILLFLASDMSKAISGAVVPVDRAWSVL